MHRSGTSYIAEKVKQLGYAGNTTDIEKNNFNPNGYNEDARVVQLHDDLLAHFDKQWGHYQHWLYCQTVGLVMRLLRMPMIK